MDSNIGIYFSYMQNGPGKVIKNLIKGFDTLKIKYKLNEEGDKNIILQDCYRLYNNLENCIIGPNIWIDNSVLLNSNKYNSFIVPSEWVKKFCLTWIPDEKMVIWPVGIDTDFFLDFSEKNKKYDFLIYFKRRDKADLDRVLKFLKYKNKSFIIIQYGNYNEQDFLEALALSKYCILINNSESQGIAVQEIMSCNLPLLVWDIKTYNYNNKNFFASSIPFWDNNCGEIFYDFNEIEDKYELLINKKYNPRKYILENLSIEKSTIEIMSILNDRI